MDFKAFAARYAATLSDVLSRLDGGRFETLVHVLLEAHERRQHIFVMGNGGSGATAAHFACDINKGCCLDLEKKFKVICLNDNLPTLLAYANDLSYESIFVEQMKNFFVPGDVVIGISGSGNSENVLKAVAYANQNGGKTAGLSGFSGGKLARLAQIPFVAPIHDMQKVEDVHLILVHMIMQAVFAALHPESRLP